jgi:hypothetical protein
VTEHDAHDRWSVAPVLIVASVAEATAIASALATHCREGSALRVRRFRSVASPFVAPDAPLAAQRVVATSGARR